MDYADEIVHTHSHFSESVRAGEWTSLSSLVSVSPQHVNIGAAHHGHSRFSVDSLRLPTSVKHTGTKQTYSPLALQPRQISDRLQAKRNKRVVL